MNQKRCTILKSGCLFLWKKKTSFLLIMHILYQWTSQSILDFCIYVYSRSCAVWCKCMHIHFGVNLGKQSSPSPSMKITDICTL